MAEIIPDRLPSNASKGEQRVFELLRGLDDDVLVYYEPIIGERYPDFVVIIPQLGVLILEVKGWYLKDLVAADNETVTVKGRNARAETHAHPMRQARDYMVRLMDRVRAQPGAEALLATDEEHQNRFRFPFAHCVVLSNITADKLAEDAKMATVLGGPRVATRDRLLELEDASPGDVLAFLQGLFDPWWSFTPLDHPQIDILRAAIHPEIRLDAGQTPAASTPQAPAAACDTGPSLQVLDTRQEQSARSIGRGHRIVYGVAGSGKTVLLLARARLAAQDPAAQVLVLCYNLTLAAYLQTRLADLANVHAYHFDGWAKAQGTPRAHGEEDDHLGGRLLQVLENGHCHPSPYDAVLIDEAQDFAPVWFQCARAALVEPDDGDLLIVGDGNQGLYRKARISWSDLGIQARGRTHSRNLDLDRNYRNSKEILALAAALARAPQGEDDDTLLSLAVDPDKAVRQSGTRPALLRCENPDREIDAVIELVAALQRGDWLGVHLERPLAPEEIGILYPYATKNDRPRLRALIDGLAPLGGCTWLNDPDDRQARRRIERSGAKLQTIHSAKGLQYRAVIVLWADLLPRPFGEPDPEGDRRLLYVALTRAEDLLAITTSRRSTLVEELEDSGDLDVHPCSVLARSADDS